jgi:hypothetical protein
MIILTAFLLLFRRERSITMSKNLNVSLAFTANTNEAIAQIKRLQKELNSLATG